MGIVEFPVERATGQAERMALRQGIVGLSAARSTVRVLGPARPQFCGSCAAPIDFAPVRRGEQAFCSVECSLGGGRPA